MVVTILSFVFYEHLHTHMNQGFYGKEYYIKEQTQKGKEQSILIIFLETAQL